MKNKIIIDNRIVSDKTFAVRLRGFMQSVTCNDACCDDEIEYFKSVANSLLDHQIHTVEDEHEIQYLTSLGHLPIKPCLTYDGVEIIHNKTTLFYCMINPSISDVPKIILIQSPKDLNTTNQNMLFFYDKIKCENYIKDNAKDVFKS